MKLIVVILLLTNFIYAAKSTSILDVIALNNEEYVSQLLRSGANIDIKSRDGYTPLMISIKSSQVKMAKFLIKNGANINSVSKSGITALMLAIIGNKPQLAMDLIKRDSNVNTVSKNGITPLTLSIYKNLSTDFLDFLISKGATVNYQTEDGWSPIMLALHKNIRKASIALLLDKKAILNDTTNDGWTPLMFAVRSRVHIDIIRRIMADSNIFAVTNSGLGAIDIARSLGYVEVLDMLKAYDDSNLTMEDLK